MHWMTVIDDIIDHGGLPRLEPTEPPIITTTKKARPTPRYISFKNYHLLDLSSWSIARKSRGCVSQTIECSRQSKVCREFTHRKVKSNS